MPQRYANAGDHEAARLLKMLTHPVAAIEDAQKL
jgi:hypothetical protein